MGRLAMKTVFEYTRSNILVIPQALFAMQDVRVLMHYQNSAIFYKALEQDLTDVEFYTSTPCFICIESGREVITESSNQEITLVAGEGIFLPQGINLHSDFVRETSSLKAWLVFFDNDIIEEYRVRSRLHCESQPQATDLCLVNADNTFNYFFHSLQADIADPEYLKIKLLELLFLIARQKPEHLSALINTAPAHTPKRNLMRLLNQHDILHLSVQDMARISGRSLSSFNRDFKALYQQSPKQWLQQKRLAHARQLLINDELSVTEVASSIGYDNISNFIKAFKSVYGQTPGQIKATE